MESLPINARMPASCTFLARIKLVPCVSCTSFCKTPTPGHSLGLDADSAEKDDTSSSILSQSLHQSAVQPLRQLLVCIDSLFSSIGIPLEPLEKRQIKACAGIEILGGVEVEVCEGGKEEGVPGELGGGRGGGEECLGGGV